MIWEFCFFSANKQDRVGPSLLSRGNVFTFCIKLYIWYKWTKSVDLCLRCVESFIVGVKEQELQASHLWINNIVSAGLLPLPEIKNTFYSVPTQTFWGIIDFAPKLVWSNFTGVQSLHEVTSNAHCLFTRYLNHSFVCVYLDD